MAGEAPLSFGNTVSLANTTASARVAVNLPASQTLIITSLGPDLTYIRIGDLTVTATVASGFPILPGTQIAISAPAGTIYVAGICPTSTSTLKVTSADGYISGVSGSSDTGGSGGENVTIVGPVDAFSHVQTALYDSAGNALTYNANGQATMANSAPVVIASDQSVIPVGGNVADNAASVGNPAYIGGIYQSTWNQSYTSGDRAAFQLDSNGNLRTLLTAPAGSFTDSSDSVYAGLVNSSNGLSKYALLVGPTLWNGSTIDVQRGNVNTAALITLAAAGAGTTNSADQTNYNGKGVIVVADITVAGGTIAVTVAIQGKDPVSGKYYTLVTTASLVGTGTTVLTVYPGATVAAGLTISTPLPRTWRVQVVSGTGITPAVTMTVGASVIL